MVGGLDEFPEAPANREDEYSHCFTRAFHRPGKRGRKPDWSDELTAPFKNKLEEQ
jgi:hypothetical protein